jgi:hypothetical protein
MTAEHENSNPGLQRTRRNIMKMSAIAVPATLATVHPASAGPICKLLGLFGVSCPVGDPRSTGNCFLKGTKILTAEGERKIEDLAIGDLLPTVFGGLRPVQWIGRYPFRKSDPSKPWVKDTLPVRIARSALAPGVPHADLYITAAHCLLVDEALVPAEMLINGTTITRYEPEGDELEFFHVKLESHDVIYAEGAPAETLVYVHESAVNFADYIRRYGASAAEESRYAPIVRLGRRDELKSRFRSALSPWIDLRTPADVRRDRLEEQGII